MVIANAMTILLSERPKPAARRKHLLCRSRPAGGYEFFTATTRAESTVELAALVPEIIAKRDGGSFLARRLLVSGVIPVMNRFFLV
jgi:hypothetical protein